MSNNTEFVYSESGKVLLKLTMDKENDRPGTFKVTAFRNGEIVAMDCFKPADALRRTKFITSIEGLNHDQRKFTEKKLLELTDRAPKAVATEPATKPVKQVSSAVLSDGRIVEQTTKGFAIYSPDQDKIEFAPSVEDKDCVFALQPLQADNRGEMAVGLASDVLEYGSEAALDNEIEKYLLRHIDLPDTERKLVVQYVKLTYLTDKLEELPYLRAVGHRGNGKSRFIHAVGMICHRPTFLVSITAASLFRLMNAYHPTLIIDEANLEADSEDTQAIMQVLNAGYQRIAKIPRVEGGNGTIRQIEYFDPFGAKILASLKIFDSAAFESRCIRILMQKTKRNDIRFRLSIKMKREAEVLRNMLLLFRFRNHQRDFETELDLAEMELKSKNIEPRYVQIGTPLYAILTDNNLRQEFAAMLKSRDNADAEERLETFDGNLVSVMHQLLCIVESENDTQIWRLKPNCVKGEPTQWLTVEAITNELNKEKPEKEQFKKEYVSKRLSKLELERKKINSRNENRDKKAVVFDPNRLGKLFENYGLPVPVELLPNTSLDNLEETTVASVAKDNKLLESNDLGWRHYDETRETENNNGRQDHPNYNNKLDGLATLATVVYQGPSNGKLFPSAVNTIISNDSEEQISCWNCSAQVPSKNSHCLKCGQDMNDLPF